MWSPQKGPTRLWDLRFSHIFILLLMSISPGAVDTEIIPDDFKSKLVMLRSEDISDAVVYCLQTPPTVQIHEMTIQPIGQMMA